MTKQIDKKDPVRKVSITFQTLATVRSKLLELAKEMGYKRMKDGQEQGELSPLLILACEYLLVHIEPFRKWIAAGKPAHSK